MLPTSGPPRDGSTANSAPPSAQVAAAIPSTKPSACSRAYGTGTCVQRWISAS